MKTFTLIFTQEELNLVNEALVSLPMPLKIMAPFMNSINKQIRDAEGATSEVQDDAGN